MHMVMLTVLSGVSMGVHQGILFVDVRVLVFMQVFVPMRVFYYPMGMLVVMVMAVLVRMDMPVLGVTVHLPSLTLPECSSRTRDLR